jgi:urocanate hydratase
MGGVARRAWARNENSIETSIQYNRMQKGADHITIPYIADDKMVEKLVAEKFRDKD